MFKNLTDLIVSLENEKGDSVQKLETEIVIYSKIGEPARLQECKSKEDHIQLETTFENGTRCRVRKVTKEDAKPQFIFTFKVPTGKNEETGLDANSEYSVDVDEDFFTGFMSVASRKLVKTRYNFLSENVTMTLKEGDNDKDIVIPNIEYEVDVYQKADGSTSEWCKIDVEVDNIVNYIHSNHKEIQDLKLNVKVSHLPFAPSNNILSFNASDEQRIKIDEIWKEFRQEVNSTEDLKDESKNGGS
jgi:hypothetical protein